MCLKYLIFIISQKINLDGFITYEEFLKVFKIQLKRF